MADGFRWVFELFDKFTAPARQMTTALRGLKTGLDTSASSFKSFDAGVNNSKMSLRDFVGTLHDAMGAARMVGGALKSVFDVGARGFQFAFQAASFKEDTMIALETMLRSKEQAKAVFDMAVKMAADTPLETEQTLGMTKQLVMQGFKGTQDLSVMLQAISDVGAMHGMNPEKMQNMLTFFGRIQSAGKLTGHAMSNLVETGTLSKKLIEEGIAKEMGVDVAQIAGLQEAGMIDAVTAIRGTLRAIADVGGGQLNLLSGRGSHALSGLMSTLKSRPFELFMKLDESKGFDRVRSFVGKLADMLNPNSTTGKGLVDGISNMFNGLLEGFFGVLDGGTLEDKLDSLFKSISKALQETDWKALGQELRLFAEDLIYLAKVGVESIKTIASVPRLLKGDAQAWSELMFGKKPDYAKFSKNGAIDMDAALRSVGANAAQGMAQGLASGAGAVAMGAQTGIVDPTIATPEKGLQMHSPSLVMRGLGRFASEGFRLGLNASPNMGLTKSLDNFVSEAPNALARKHAPSGASPVTFNIHAPAETAEKIKAVLVQALPEVFEGVALEVGAA